MPSSLHEALLEILRRDPSLACELASRQSGVRLPRWDRLELVDTALSQLVPAEFRVDLAVLLRARGVPTFGLLVEAQLRIDRRKLFTWPLYAAAVRARHRCPTGVLVLTTDERVARWARRPVLLGGPGHVFQALVAGPSDLPAVHTAEEARRRPLAALLAALAQGRRPDAVDEVQRALTAVAELGVEDALFLGSLLLGSVDHRLAKAVLERVMSTPTDRLHPLFLELFEHWKKQGLEQGREQGLEQGREQGRHEASRRHILRILSERGLPVPDAVRRKVEACGDPELLERWFGRAMQVARPEDLFSDD